MAPFKDKWVRRFVINETSRHKQGFTIYKVTSMIFPKSSPDTVSKVSVWKRYNDFKALHENLKIVYATLQIKEDYPPFPKPKFFGRFEAEVVEERRKCAVNFLEFISRHSSLCTNDIFVTFFESNLGANHCALDCLQLVNSDTSEDDKSTIFEESGNVKEIANQDVDGIKNRPNNKLGQDTLTNNCRINGKVLSIKNAISLDRNICSSFDKESQMFNNKNIDKCSEDTNWQECSSVENLAETGYAEVSQCRETSLTVDEGSDSADTRQDSGQYILISAAHMSAGLKHEAIAEYGEAFMQYKLGISNLRNGVKKDPDSVRRATIKHKIIQYSERATKLYNRHLNCNISMISKPESELRYYKVLRVMGTLMLVNDVHQNTTRVIKTVEKPVGVQEDVSKYILQGQVPYMVHLHACIQTETTIFLILQYVSGGKFWDFLKRQYAIPQEKIALRKKTYAKSTNCEGAIHPNSAKRMNSSLERSQGESLKLDNMKIFPLLNENSMLHGSLDDLDEIARESLRKLEEELGARMMYNKDIPTIKLVEKAQKLLESVDATIKKSNSIATRLNESRRLLYENDEMNESKETDDCDNSEESCDISELSISDSYTDSYLSTESDRPHDVATYVADVSTFPQISSSEMHDVRRDALRQSEQINDYVVCEKEGDKDRSYNDEDSGIEMEQELWRIPEVMVKSWAAQMLLTLEALHHQNVVISDLRPDNLLMDGNCGIIQTYVVPRQSPELSRYQRPYAAPELSMYLPVVPATPAADVWSFGIILYELLTGIPFQFNHPGPLHSHSIINIPNELSEGAKALLTKVLRFEPSERLNIAEIKQLPFFEKTNWPSLLHT